MKAESIKREKKNTFKKIWDMLLNFLFVGVCVTVLAGCGSEPEVVNPDDLKVTNLQEATTQQSQTNAEASTQQSQESTEPSTQQNQAGTEPSTQQNQAGTEPSTQQSVASEDGQSIGTPTDYYKVATSKTAQEVEAYAEDIRWLLLKKDFESLAKEVAYPITIGEERYESREEFLNADFASKISEKFLEKLEAETCQQMFCNYQGIMLGDDGVVWIAEVLNNDYSSAGLKIIALNDMVESIDLTFADLAERQFGFSSGVGAWSEEFTIEKDGYFSGKFYDTDMGDVGEGYSDGTLYCSSYSGHFTNLTKVNNHTYQMKLEDISYKENAGIVKIINNVRYIYTLSDCLGGTDTFTIYLPGTPLSELPESVRGWISMMNQSESELTMLVIADETNGYGIYSHDRADPLEDALMTFDSYKDSYDYFSKKVSEAVTTAEMVEYTGCMYEISDDCLNYIWNLIRYNVDEDKYDEILNKQREWISEKEAKAKEISAAYSDGSFAAVSYNDALAELTIKRCEELIEFLK